MGSRNRLGRRLAAIVFAGNFAAAGPAPHIVLILADDLGYGDVGVYNPESRIPTPHIDRLAAGGIRLTDAHAPAATCSPTRYGLMTGRYPWRAGIGGALGPWSGPRIEPDRLTVPALLRRHGYVTACVGKWHLGWNWPTLDGKPPKTTPDHASNVDFSKSIGGGPPAAGFDRYFGVDVPNYPPYCFIENDRTVGLPSEPSSEFEFPGPKLPGWSQMDILPELARRASGFIEEQAQGGSRFFLFFSLTSPHHPVVPTPEFRGASSAGDYGDFVAQTDGAIGQVLDALARSGAASNTLVIVTSDNGPEITRTNVLRTKNVMAVGVYDRIREYGHASAGPFRGSKYSTWEAGHRVPFIARWPGRIPPGGTGGGLVCLTDLLATCADIVGESLPPGAGPDSVSMLPALTGGKSLRTGGVFQGTRQELAVRDGDWVWINHPASIGREPDWFRELRSIAGDNAPEQLFNLRDDPGQTKNLFAEHPERVQALRRRLDEIKNAETAAATAER